MGEAALKFGATTASRNLAKLGMQINKSITQGLKKAHVSERQRKRHREKDETDESTEGYETSYALPEISG